MSQLPLIVDAPVSLVGYQPKFNRQEVELGLTTFTVQEPDPYAHRDPDDFGGFGIGGPYIAVTHYKCVVEGVELHEPQGWRALSYLDRFGIVVAIINNFIANKRNKELHPRAWDFIATNVDDLNRSRRYWAAVDHLEKIAEKEREIAELEAQVKRAKIVASLLAAEVWHGTSYTETERERRWAELSGGLPYRE